jgi:hypothetical protein
MRQKTLGSKSGYRWAANQDIDEPKLAQEINKKSQGHEQPLNLSTGAA